MVRRSSQPPKLVVTPVTVHAAGSTFHPLETGHIVDRRSCLCRFEWLSRRRCWIVVRSLPPAGVRVWVVRPLAGCLSGSFYSVQPIRGIDLSYIYTLNAAKRNALKHAACCCIAAHGSKCTLMVRKTTRSTCVALHFSRLRKIWTFTPARYMVRS